MSNWQGRLPPLSPLVPFDAAFRHQNFTRAAEELHFSQATISRRISELEAHLGVQLFERRHRDAKPTAAAQVLADAVQLAFGELATATETIKRTAGQSNTLTVCTDLSLATTVISPIIGDFQRQHPGLEIRVLSSFEPIETTSEIFDIGVQYGRSNTTSRLRIEPIADDQIFPVASPELAALVLSPDEPASPVSAGDLLALPLLHVDYAEPAWTDWHQFLEMVGARTPAAREGMTFTSYLVCLDVAERGEGVALGWGRTVQPLLEAGRLVRIPGLVMPIPDAISAYLPMRRDPNPYVDDFLDSLKRS